MSAIREAVTSAIANSDLTWAKDGEERPVDRIVASAWTGERLGQLLWRIKYARERTQGNLVAALYLVVFKINGRTQFGRGRASPTVVSSCAAALDEWINDGCPLCEARGYVRIDDRPRACGRCAGTGRMEWTDAVRRLKVGTGYDVKRYQRVLQKLQEADHRQGKGTRSSL